MEIKESKQVYVAKYGTPTIQLGDGETVISDIHASDGFHGICFSQAVTNNGVGGEHDVGDGALVTDINAYLQIISTNPASFDVLINQCIKARDALLEAVD